MGDPNFLYYRLMVGCLTSIQDVGASRQLESWAQTIIAVGLKMDRCLLEEVDKGTGAETRIYPDPFIFTPEFGIKKSGYTRNYTVHLFYTPLHLKVSSYFSST